MNRYNKDSSFSDQIPDGDNIPRAVCNHCGFINYENPKIVVGSVVLHEGKFLMCRRAIEPRHGYWTLPAGFMEKGETTEEGAQREAMEEANANIRIRDLLAIYSIPRISQVQLMYRAELIDPHVSAGEESLEVDFIAWDDIPWSELAFPSVHWALMQFNAVRDQAVIVPFGNPDGQSGNRFPEIPTL